MLRKLYAWTLSLAGRRAAEGWLALIAFVESSIFLVPADVLFLPMALARPERIYRYALVAAAASVAGGIAGWLLGFYAYESIAKPVLAFYGKLDTFEQLKSHVGEEQLNLLLVTSGLAHLPPIKVVTILAGVVHVKLWHFVTSAVIARGLRFYLLAFLLKRYGVTIQAFVERRLGLTLGAVAAVIIGFYAAWRLLAG